MRILVISNLYPPVVRGGYELSCAQMVGALRAAGHQVLVVTSRQNPPAGDERRPGIRRTLELPPIYETDRLAEMSPHERRRVHLHSNYVNTRNTELLAEAIEQFQPDVAYLWNTLGLGGLGILALLAHYGLPWVWHIADLIPVQLTRFGAGGGQLSQELTKVFPGRLLFVSGRVLGENRVEGADLGDQIRLIRNAVDPTTLPLRTEFFSDGTLRLIYAAATLSQEKGTGIAIDAVALARSSTQRDITLDIYGREADSSYRRQIEKLELQDAVRIQGPRAHHELVKLYRSYDVVLYPSWSREPFGRIPLDAAGQGCVPLFTDDIGAAEWLIDGVDCLKAYRSADAFAKRIVDVVTGVIELAPLARRAQSIVHRDFTLSGKRRQVEAALAEAAASRRLPWGDGTDFMKLAHFAEELAERLLVEGEVVT